MGNNTRLTVARAPHCLFELRRNLHDMDEMQPRQRKQRGYEGHDRTRFIRCVRCHHHAFIGSCDRPLDNYHRRTGCTDHPIGRRTNDSRKDRVALVRHHHDQIGTDLMGQVDQAQGR